MKKFRDYLHPYPKKGDRLHLNGQIWVAMEDIKQLQDALAEALKEWEIWASESMIQQNVFVNVCETDLKRIEELKKLLPKAE